MLANPISAAIVIVILINLINILFYISLTPIARCIAWQSNIQKDFTFILSREKHM